MSNEWRVPVFPSKGIIRIVIAKREINKMHRLETDSDFYG